MPKAKNADVPAQTNIVDQFDYSKCKFHNVEMLESEYITHKLGGTFSILLNKGYVFPIKTRGGRLLYKEWSFRNAGYIDKHLHKEQIDPRFPITTRPKIIIRLKYNKDLDSNCVAGWNAVSPKEYIQFNVDDCKKKGIDITNAHKKSWQDWLYKLTFLKHDTE